MESGGRERLESLFKVLVETLGEQRRPAALAGPAGQDAQDTDWVIERIQDSFDSRAR